jgi:hypothetical protein
MRFQGKPLRKRVRIISSATQAAAPSSVHVNLRSHEPWPILPESNQTQMAGYSAT